MKKYKYITIDEDGEFDSKPQYKIINNKTKKILGLIIYYQQWRQYVFTQFQGEIIFNKSCLLDIVDFIEKEAPNEM